MDDFEITIDTKAMDEALSRLPEKVQGRIAREALQKAGDIMLEAQKFLCPERTDDMPGSDALEPGVLKESLTTQVIISTKGEVARVKVGAPSETAHVARWVNDGHDIYKGGRKRASKNKKAGKFLGHVEGKHFLEGAFDESAQKAIDAMLTAIGEGLKNDSEGGE